MASVELQSVGKSFGSTTVLRDVDIEIQDGEFVALLGPSGCGKSTLLNRHSPSGLRPDRKIA